jgi:hypothetical protein
MNPLVQFMMIMSVGLVIPHIVTSNKGFNVPLNTVCGVNDKALEWISPASDYLRKHPVVQ